MIAATNPRLRVSPITGIRKFLTELLTSDPIRAEPVRRRLDLEGPLLPQGVFRTEDTQIGEDYIGWKRPKTNYPGGPMEYSL